MGLQGLQGLSNGPGSPVRRAYVRQSGVNGPAAQVESDAVIACSLPGTPLPGSICLFFFEAEAPNHGSNATNPNMWGLTQTGYIWSPAYKHGGLDQTYPYHEIWVGRPTPGVPAGTVITPNSHRGGWCTTMAAEIPNIQGLVLGVKVAWASALSPGTFGPITPNVVAPEDCIAVMAVSMDSGADGNLGTLDSSWPTRIDLRMSIKTVRKGELPSATVTGLNGGTNDKAIMTIAYIK